MENKVNQTLWVTSIQPIEINEKRYIPTVIYYEKNGASSVGYEAIDKAPNKATLSTDFKIALGDVVPGGAPSQRTRFRNADGQERTAFHISRDYIDGVLSKVEHSFPRSEKTDYKHPARIIVAEPLSFQTEGYSKQWISNYRDNIRRILSRYLEVEFLPEPFAVYQYYRYGLRIPHLQDKTKTIAFIIDFGGGTFDACIIESTVKGDISLSGKNSKPLSADSTPVGGFYINKEIAKYLIKRNLLDSEKSKADRYIKQYERILKGELDLESLKDECQIFIRNLKVLESNAEYYKLELSAKITDWSLGTDSYEKIFVSVPRDPFIDSPTIDAEFYSHQLRELFYTRVWKLHLSAIVERVLDRAKESLSGRNVNVTLISGGSSNLRWMERLLKRDFSEHLEGAEPVPINHSFQEIVANGLAIECARRFYSVESEFVAVTYNPIKLFLDPDGSGVEKSHRFKSIEDKVDMSCAKHGDLIPSAQSLKHFFDAPIYWKVKLGKPPKNYLDYYFCRPDSEDEFDSYNVEETRVFTRNGKFDKAILVELIVREDGTVLPRFIYKSGNQQFDVPENSVEGRPFYIDMTSDSDPDSSTEHYIGLDFGTSNSSICVLNKNQIMMTSTRESSDNWRGLSNSLSDLPFPVAYTLRKFLSSFNDEESATIAREAFESCLAFMAYCAVAECSSKGLRGKLMNNFRHRSMGPLVDLLRAALRNLGESAEFCVGFTEIFKKEGNALDAAINDFNNHKHDKITASGFPWQDYLEIIVSVLAKNMRGKLFGYCSTCGPKAFAGDVYEGIFVVAHDNAPFIKSVKYTTGKSVDNTNALIVDEKTGDALSLSPYIFWHNRRHTNLVHGCYWLDKIDHSYNISVKVCDEKMSCLANEIHPDLASHIAGFLTESSITDCDRFNLNIRK